MNRVKSLAGIVIASSAVAPALADTPNPDAVTFESLMAQVGAAVPATGQARPLVLYSWTTHEQARAIRKGGQVLVRTKSPTQGYSTFDQWLSLHANASQPNEIAKLLFADGFGRKRFAWPNALGAIRGLGGGSYGDVLLRIELRPESTFVEANHRSGTFVASNAVGSVRATPLVPATIAAVSFTTHKFREYVVLNESMIASVSIATPAVMAQLRLEIALLEAVDVHNASNLAALAELILLKAPVDSDDITDIKAALRRTLVKLGTKPYYRAVTSPFVLGAQRPAVANSCKIQLDATYIGMTCSATCSASSQPDSATTCIPDPPLGR
jgi:hypothetical protein